MTETQTDDPLSDGIPDEPTGRGALSRLSLAASDQPELAGETGTQSDASAPVSDTVLLSGRCESTAGLATVRTDVGDSRCLDPVQAAAGGGVGSPMGCNGITRVAQ